DFLREIETMKVIGTHPNIVNLIGCITTTEFLCLVMEFCSNGDLLSYLRSHRPAEKDSNQFSLLSIKQLISFGWQVSFGLEHIIGKGYIHRDIAARNVMLHEGKRAKVDYYLNIKLSKE